MAYRSLAHTIRELLTSSSSGENLYEVRRGPTPASTREKQRKGAKKARASRSTKPLVYKTKKGRSVFISRKPIFETVRADQPSEKPITKIQIDSRTGSLRSIASTRAGRRKYINLKPIPTLPSWLRKFIYVNPYTDEVS